MTQNNRDNATQRAGKAGQTVDANAEREAAAKAVRDNMARLKALRLAKEAASPTPTVKVRAKAGSKAGSKATGKASGKAEKGQDLSDWLASQRSGGYRT
ncbi:MAG: hypothetical protein J0H25_16925 [Rhizobiales bacterium]|jgi:hypothetical protein|nr:hypothetical protein [Hyphomicrobiales bacterium]MBN9014673.1 hypothetical protein [Hyphomicrobiales bacterium]